MKKRVTAHHALGRCLTCERTFVVTLRGTIPGHTTRVQPWQTCPGAYREAEERGGATDERQ